MCIRAYNDGFDVSAIAVSIEVHCKEPMMPIYEFYCRDCHTIFSFFARRVDTETVPKCPKHARHKLRRQMSRFAISSGRSESPSGDGPEPDFDE
jgi:putative FmdB family regulatory protein